jgi:hypothetical protein
MQDFNLWWFQILSIFQNETLNLEGVYTLVKIHIYSVMTNNKKCDALGSI